MRARATPGRVSPDFSSSVALRDLYAPDDLHMARVEMPVEAVIDPALTYNAGIPRSESHR